ncbi:MAG: ATP-binding cassette domain-containing protein [Chitinophagales bacterium]|nr:ATP-binding cassette domain-containing protein [Chitinophagales bacterium]
MIEVIGIEKSFQAQRVLKGIDVTFEKGQCNLIIGKSGAGKTVFMSCLVGLIQPDNGQILFDNRDIVKMNHTEKSDLRREVGMLFQKNALFDSMTIEENVRFPLDMFTNMSAFEKKERVDFCLQRVSLMGANDKYPSEISGGMMKRVALARAIVLNPKYLFCDEPNSGLDPQTAIVIDNLIKEITYEFNITTVVVSHDMNSVIEIGDYINFIYQGELWWKGDKKEILKTQNDELNNFVFPSEFMKEIKEVLREGRG